MCIYNVITLTEHNWFLVGFDINFHDSLTNDFENLCLEFNLRYEGFQVFHKQQCRYLAVAKQTSLLNATWFLV